MNVAQVPSTKTDYVYQTIRAEILAGRLQPGQRLRLTHLAERYSISEMPVREALRKLEHDGLIEFESHRGATVLDLTLDRIVEIIATRTYLEAFAVIESMPHHSKETLKQLQALVAKMKKTSAPADYLDLNRRFHRLLIEPCRNSFLKSEIDQVWNKVWQTHSESLLEILPARMVGATIEHEEIANALAQRDQPRLERALRSHREATLTHWRTLAEADKLRRADGSK